MDDEPKPVLLGFILHELCFYDGKINFGTFEEFTRNPPLNFSKQGTNNKSSIKYTVQEISKLKAGVKTAQFIPNPKL